MEIVQICHTDKAKDLPTSTKVVKPPQKNAGKAEKIRNNKSRGT